MKVPVSIEINERVIKIVTAKPFLSQRQVAGCVVKPIDGLNDKQISALISGILRETKIKPQPLIISIPRSQVTVRSLHLPSKDKAEINQMLDLHISRLVPYKKEEILFDYIVVGTDNMNYSKLMLAIVHKDILKRQLRILEAADLLVDKMYLSSYGVWERILSLEKQNINVNSSRLYIALDIDSACTDFMIFDANRLLFNRSINMDLSGGFGQPEMTKLIGEVRQSMVIFHNEESSENPVKIFLSGAPVIEELQKAMQEEFDIPVKVVSSPCPVTTKDDLAKTISFTAVSNFVLEDSDKRISFMLPEAQIKKVFKDRMRELTILGILIIYFLAASFLFLWNRVSSQQSYLNNLSEYNRSLEKDVGGALRDYKRIKSAKAFVHDRKMLLVLIEELQNITPQDITIDMINADESGNVSLKGIGNHSSDIFNYIAAMDASRHFKGAAAKYMRTKKIDDREITNFEITFKFIAAGDAAEKK
jgi:Tfp pilus assembly PilM family ATPase